MPKITIEINNCKQCPHFKIGGSFSTDNFDRMEDWMCTKANKKIQGSVEWHEERHIKIPNWCPIEVNSSVSDWWSNGCDCGQMSCMTCHG